MKFLCTSLLLMIMLNNGHLFSQNEQEDTTFKRYFIGSSLFMLANFTDDSPSFYQLNLGKWLTQKDVVMVELITWKYNWPLGIPWGPSFDHPDEEYPGYVREYGIGMAYQRFLWKDLYADIEAVPLLQHYHNLENEKIQNGFQLFLTFRTGYHIRLFQNTIFLEPSLAFNYWPVNTNVPESFARIENRWPNYFLFEPGLHFGLKF